MCRRFSSVAWRLGRGFIPTGAFADPLKCQFEIALRKWMCKLHLCIVTLIKSGEVISEADVIFE